MHNSTDFGGGFGLNFKFNATLDMQNIKESMLKHVRIYAAASGNVLLKLLFQQMCASTSSTNPDEIMDQVIGLVKKFDKIDAHKVTETADFQKDLSLDSLELVELVMAFEKEFSIEIPQEKADNKLTCCADVAKYIQASKAGESTNDDKY